MALLVNEAVLTSFAVSSPNCRKVGTEPPRLVKLWIHNNFSLFIYETPLARIMNEYPAKSTKHTSSGAYCRITYVDCGQTILEWLNIVKLRSNNDVPLFVYNPPLLFTVCGESFAGAIKPRKLWIDYKPSLLIYKAILARLVVSDSNYGHTLVEVISLVKLWIHSKCSFSVDEPPLACFLVSNSNCGQPLAEALRIVKLRIDHQLTCL